MLSKRKQLTLFINENDSKEIESIRCKYNPAQYNLIKSHITLCREDEMEDFEKVIENLNTLHFHSITFHFTKPLRFSDGCGVMLPGANKNVAFDKLRKTILYGTVKHPQKQHPHITLMHPRNSFCTDDIFTEIEKISLPNIFSFTTIHLIEEGNGGKWELAKAFKI